MSFFRKSIKYTWFQFTVKENIWIVLWMASIICLRFYHFMNYIKHHSLSFMKRRIRSYNWRVRKSPAGVEIWAFTSGEFTPGGWAKAPDRASVLPSIWDMDNSFRHLGIIGNANSSQEHIQVWDRLLQHINHSLGENQEHSPWVLTLSRLPGNLFMMYFWSALRDTLVTR